MAHAHLRDNKICLNCGSVVNERYCSHCGQENTEPSEPFSHLVGHFFADVTHFDSQIFTTIKDLVSKPGFLTNAYISGQRIRYLNPIRMYIFISAVFFVFAFWHWNKEQSSEPSAIKGQAVNAYRQHLADSLRILEESLPGKRPDLVAEKNVYNRLAARLDTAKMADTTESVGVTISNDAMLRFHFVENKYADISQFDSAQLKFPDSMRSGKITTYIFHKIIRLTRGQGRREINVENDMAHDLPKLMFVLLPLFAFYVGLFYRKRNYLYSRHAIFALHFHSFVFICFILLAIVGKIFKSDQLWLIISVTSLVGMLIYLTVALCNVYKDGRWLSLLKSIGISLIYSATLLLALGIYIVIKFALL